MLRSLLVVAAVTAACAAHPQLPNGYAWGCLPGEVSANMPFCDPSLSISTRLSDLVNRLTLDEMIGLMTSDNHSQVSSCNMMGAGVPRLGIPAYMHLVETNTAVASTCLGPAKCSTNYPGPTGLGASFNRTLWHAKGHAMGEEMRAFNNLRWYRGTGDAPHSLIGLNGYGPNLNIARDPRYGRTSELPGEDPFLTGSYAVQMVRGGQGMDQFESGDSKFLKMTLGLKHYDLYSVEEPRASFIPNVSAHDLWETYLPQYLLGFSNLDPDGNPAGGAMGTMCSYAGLNGVPSCANDYLLNRVIRSEAGFNRSEVVVGTDCGAVSNMVNANHYATSSLDASAKTLNGGTDMVLGGSEWSAIANGGQGLLKQALGSKTVTKERIALSAERILRLRFLTGQFDPVAAQPYTQIGAEAVNSSAAQQLNLEAALQSFVLLKNDASVLPFRKGLKTAVLGPHVLSRRDLMSDYKGDMQCVGGSEDFSCIPTIAETFSAFNGAENTVVQPGVDIDSTNSSGVAAALAAAGSAQQVLLFVGIGASQEHEGIDRHNTSLPGLQEPFTLQVLALCKQKNIPAAVVLINAGMLAIDPIVPAASGIVEAFYPSVRGAEALALTLFGEANRWGKLPVTMYPKEFIEQVDMHDFEMGKPPGRTYKYYTGTPLFPFGHGLNYNTELPISCQSSPAQAPMLLSISCSIHPAKGRAGDEVLLAYHSVDDAIRAAARHPVPLKELVGFSRASYDPMRESDLGTIQIGPNQLGVVDEDGNLQLLKGTHFIEVSNGNQFSVKFNVTVDQSRLLRAVPQLP